MFLRFFVFAIVLAQSALAQVILQVDKGTFTLTITGQRPETVGSDLIDYVIEGAIRNNTEFDYTLLHLNMVGYDAGGQDLKMCDDSKIAPKCDLRILGPILAGQTAKLEFPNNVIFPSVRRMKGVAKVAFQVVRAPYRVKYRVESSPLVNEHFTVTPVFDTRGIALEFRSTSDVLEISWDQSVYIDETGNASRLIRSNVRLVEKDRPQPNTVVPPGTKLREIVFPIDRIKQDKDGSLYQAGLFPEIVENGASDKTALSSLIGKEIRLFLRLLVNDQKQNVTIPFKVVQVDY